MLREREADERERGCASLGMLEKCLPDVGPLPSSLLKYLLLQSYRL